VAYHDSFQLVDSCKKPPGSRGHKAAAANVDKQGNEWTTPFEWLSLYKVKGIKTRWTCAFVGTGICPICHHAEKPWHVPANCPLLKELNLKLDSGPPPSSPAPAQGGPPAPTPAASATPSPSPSPGGRVAFSADTPLPGSAPSGLMATVEDDYGSDDDFRWAGDEEGLDYSAVSGHHVKSNTSVGLYHVSVETLDCSPTLHLCTAPSPRALLSKCIVLPDCLNLLLFCMSVPSISPSESTGSGSCFTVADTGAADHMFPDKSAFISYTRIPSLQVRTGNNSYLLVLGLGTAINSLNGQWVLVHHALHVPGLAVSLYSLHAHFKQRGCGFIGTSASSMLVYFPNFVLLIDTSLDCLLSYDPLGHSAPLDTLHYIRPRCPPSLYPSELAASSNKITPSLHVIEDDAVTTLPPPTGMPTSMMLLYRFILTRLSAVSLLCQLCPRPSRHFPQTFRLSTLHPLWPSFFPWLIHSRTLCGQYRPQILHLPLLFCLPYSSWLCHSSRSTTSSTTRVLLFHQFYHVIRQMLRTS